MTPPPGSTLTTGSLRCSVWARQENLSPIGTAGTYDGFLLLPLPLPWPRDISEKPEVAAVSSAVAGQGLRLQAIIPAPNDVPQVIVYLRPADTDGFRGYQGYRAPATGGLGRLHGAVEAVLDPERATDQPGRVLLVCTHGKRDVCCGSQGTELALELARGDLPGDVQLRRTSHTGGHRFAPTFIVLPEGTAWAFADAELVDTVLNRRGEAGEVTDHYRGCPGVGSREVQTLEREVLAQVGWTLLDRGRRGGIIETDGTQSLVELEVLEGSKVERWRGVVSPGRTMKVPDCMKPIEEAKKSETELTVRDVVRV